MWGAHVARNSRMVLVAAASGAPAVASTSGATKVSAAACGMGSSTAAAVVDGPKSLAAAWRHTHSLLSERRGWTSIAYLRTCLNPLSGPVGTPVEMQHCRS